MAETPHKERGENRDLQTIGLVREENGGGREAKEESVGWWRLALGAHSGGWMWGTEAQAEWDGEPEQS